MFLCVGIVLKLMSECYNMQCLCFSCWEWKTVCSPRQWVIICQESETEVITLFQR